MVNATMVKLLAFTWILFMLLLAVTKPNHALRRLVIVKFFLASRRVVRLGFAYFIPLPSFCHVRLLLVLPS